MSAFTFLCFHDRNCLITGADGFLGAHLARALVEAGANVVGAALSRKGQSSLSALGSERHLQRLEYGDMTDFAFVQRLVNAYEIDYVFHLAAVSAVRIAQSCPQRAFLTNVVGTLNVLEACRSAGRPVRGIVVASSDKAYGATAPPYWEGLALEPTGTYEASKAGAEMLCRAYRFEHGLPLAVTRCANLWGPGDLNWSRLVPGSVRRALTGQPPVVYQESAASVREFLHVADAVSAYLVLAEVAGERAHLEYNVGGERAAILDVAQRVAVAAAGPLPLLVPRPGVFCEIGEQAMASGRIGGLGWQRHRSLETHLRETVTWYREYLAGSMLVSGRPVVSTLAS